MKYKYLFPSKINKLYKNKKVFQINLPKPPSKSEIKLIQVTQVTDTPNLVKYFVQKKIPKSKTYDVIAQIESLKSSNGCFGLLIHKGTGCEVASAQKNIFYFY